MIKKLKYYCDTNFWIFFSFFLEKILDSVASRDHIVKDQDV